MKFPPDFGFYGILTDPPIGYERLAALMVSRTVRMIQLRMKGAPPEAVIETGRRLRKIITGDSRLIINDDPAVALDVGADGVHLGQEDMPYAEARQILGPDAIIGISTHTAEQLRAACALRPDYVAIGPVFATSTKALKDPVLGIAGLTELFGLATVPAVAIGGIDHENAPALLAAGVRNVACISCIAHATDPAESLDRMLRLFQPSPNRS